MFRIPGEQLKRVRKYVNHGLERFDRTFGAARQIQDDGIAANAAEAAAQGRERSVARALGAHALGDAFEEAIAEGAGSFGSDIARGDAGSPGGDHQTSFFEQLQNGGANGGFFVGNDAGGGDVKPLLAQ